MCALVLNNKVNHAYSIKNIGSYLNSKKEKIQELQDNLTRNKDQLKDKKREVKDINNNYELCIDSISNQTDKINKNNDNIHNMSMQLNELNNKNTLTKTSDLMKTKNEIKEKENKIKNYKEESKNLEKTLQSNKHKTENNYKSIRDYKKSLELAFEKSQSLYEKIKDINEKNTNHSLTSYKTKEGEEKDNLYGLKSDLIDKKHLKDIEKNMKDITCKIDTLQKENYLDTYYNNMVLLKSENQKLKEQVKQTEKLEEENEIKKFDFCIYRKN